MQRLENKCEVVELGVLVTAWTQKNLIHKSRSLHYSEIYIVPLPDYLLRSIPGSTLTKENSL